MSTNRINYNQEMKKIMEEIRASYASDPSAEKVRLLLHACCAPCASSCLERLKDIFDITVYFYNPNIASEEEYDKRAKELERFISLFSPEVKLIVADYNPEEFFSIARGYEDCPERGSRCKRCYDLRLRETARYSQKHSGYDYFATTLTLSPLKDADELNRIGYSLMQELGVGYLPSDFKKDDGYKRSIELSKEFNLYRQNFCGCTYSRPNNDSD